MTKQPDASRFSVAKLNCPVSTILDRGASRERAICLAVIELVNESGYESVTMDAVAARAKASKATIYRRWSKKGDLLLDAVRRGFAASPAEVPDTGSLRGDLVARIAMQLGNPIIVATNTAALRGLVDAGANDPDLADKLWSQLKSAQLSAWQLILDRAHSRGELAAAVDAAVAWEIAQGQLCTRTSVDRRDIEPAYLDHIVDNVLLPVIAHAGLARSDDDVLVTAV